MTFRRTNIPTNLSFELEKMHLKHQVENLSNGIVMLTLIDEKNNNAKYFQVDFEGDKIKH